MTVSLPSRRTQSGFSLVEMLLAFTLMAMLLSLAYGGFRAATRAAASGQAVLEDSGSVRVTHQFVRRQLNQMLPLAYDMAMDRTESPVVFEGQDRRIQFVAPMPGYLGQGGPQVQYLEFAQGEEGLELLFSHQLLQGYDPAYMVERDPIVLLEGVERAQFEFLAVDESGEPLAWTTTWDTPAVLPRAVRLDIEFAGDGHRSWPLLMTGVKVDSQSAGQAGDQSDYSNAIRSLINRSSKRPR